ncbi:MAG: TPM domain-containing protein [Bacteroidota bacterium]|nr:TPM domain-containing protein [Bacteroidota bacterium]
MKNFISEYLSDDSLETIVKSIGEIEKKTSGEIRVCLRKARSFGEKNDTHREIAIKEFVKLGIDKTEQKTGVLIFIMFGEHKFEFIADEGINSKIDPDHWDKISTDVTDYFSKEKYLEGILYGLNTLGEVLIREFPLGSDDKDELSNEIIIRH